MNLNIRRAQISSNRIIATEKQIMLCGVFNSIKFLMLHSLKKKKHTSVYILNLIETQSRKKKTKKRTTRLAKS